MMGFTARKAFFIITPEWEKVRDRILHEMERGVTELMAKGSYSGVERPVLMCVINGQ